MAEIDSRLMTEGELFSGLRNASELKAVFVGDDAAIFPPDAGLPFGEYFAQLASANGWKLEDLADRIWAEYETCWNELSIKAPLEVGMQYITSTVTSILEFASDHDKPGLLISDDSIKKCVKQSGCSASAQILNSWKKRGTEPK